MQRRIYETGEDEIILTAAEQRTISKGLGTLRVLCRLAPQDGDTVGRAVQAAGRGVGQCSDTIPPPWRIS